MPTNVTIDQQQTSVSVDDFETNVSVDADANITAVVAVDKTYSIVQEDGVDLSARPKINFVTGVQATDDAGSNRTNISIVDNTTTQKIEVADNGSLIGTRKRVNFIPGTNVTLSISDDSGGDKVDVTINSNEAAYNTVQEDGTPLTQRDVINFDATILAADDAGNTRTNVGVVDNTNTQKTIVSDNGTQTSTRQEINFIDGTNITVNVADNSGSDRADVTINGPTLHYQLHWHIAGTLTTGDMQGIVHKADRAATITDITLNCKTAPSGGAVVIDIETATSMAGPWTTIFSTQAQIADGQQEGGGSATFSDTTIADGDFIRLNIDTATSPSDDLSVHLNMTY